jgi:hypothetical protein
MADRKVNVMTAAGLPVDATDILYLVRVGDVDPDRKVTIPYLRKALDIKGGGSVKITIINNITVNGTPTEILDEDGLRISIEDDTTMTFSALFVARRTDANNESAGYKIEGVIDRNAGTVALVGPVLHFALAEDQAPWTVEASADNVNKALVFFATGEVGKTIIWRAIVTTVKATG